MGSDVVVTVDAMLLATLVAEKPSKASKSQKLSMYLSTRFNRTPRPRASGILTPTWEVAQEGVPVGIQTQVEESLLTPMDEILYLSTDSTAKRMVEAMKTAMVTQ